MNKRQLTKPEPPSSQQSSQPTCRLQTESRRHAEAQEPRKHAGKSTALLKNVVTMPFKALISQRGAEVHDSSGLDKAIAYYVSASLKAENRFWAGSQGQALRAQGLWG